MGRAKKATEFISKEKTRNTTLVKRVKSLIKKGHQLSILCNVPICIIIYPYKEGKNYLPMEAQVYSFKGDDETASHNAIDMDIARDPLLAREIIDRYLRVPKEGKSKRARNLHDMFDEGKRRANHQEVSKLKHHNNNALLLAKYPCWDSSFDRLNPNQLLELLVHLNQKIEFVKQRIDFVKGFKAYDTNQSTLLAMSLVPYFEPTPISSVMNPSENHAHHQMGYPKFEGLINQVPFYNFPTSNNNNNNNPQDYCHQIMPFNQNVYHDQVGAPRLDDHGASSSSSNLVMYNMDPTYYDQKPGIVDNGGAISSYGAGLPTSMTLQLPNVSIPRQMFYR